jgi:hypothetical protein
MKDERVLESLLNALDVQQSVIDETLVRRILEVATSHQFDEDRSMASDKLMGLVTDFVDQKMAAEQE